MIQDPPIDPTGHLGGPEEHEEERRLDELAARTWVDLARIIAGQSIRSPEEVAERYRHCVHVVRRALHEVKEPR